jgi:hypothetical protein
VLGLADHATLAAPAIQRAPSEVGEAADRATLCQALRRGGGEVFSDRADQALVAGEPEQVVDTVGLAPCHEGFPSEARVGAQQDPHPWPAHPDLVDDPLDLGHGARRRVDVGAAELGREQVPTAKHIQRQVAVAVIVAVEEAAFLVAMQRVIGSVEIEDDLARRSPVGVEEEIDEQALDGAAVVADLVVARWSPGCVLEPVERALPGQRRAILTPGDELAGKGRQHRVMTQLIMVDEILVSQRDPKHPLGHHRRNAVLDQRLGTPVIKAGGEPVHQPDRPIGRAEEQRPGIGCDLAAVEPCHHPAAFDHFITEQVAATLCRHRGTPLLRFNSLSQKNYRRFRAPMHLSL